MEGTGVTAPSLPLDLFSQGWRCSAPARRGGGRTPRSAGAHWRYRSCARSRRRVARGRRIPLDPDGTTMSRLLAPLPERSTCSRVQLSAPRAEQRRARGPDYGDARQTESESSAVDAEGERPGRVAEPLASHSSPSAVPRTDRTPDGGMPSVLRRSSGRAGHPGSVFHPDTSADTALAGATPRVAGSLVLRSSGRPGPSAQLKGSHGDHNPPGTPAVCPRRGREV
jgi:hypothetical protein